MNIERAFIAKDPHVPKYLYKYRRFTPNHIDAFEKGVLWMSAPEKLNDPYEAAVSFDPDRFLTEDQSAEEFIDYIKKVDRMLRAGGSWQPRNYARPIHQGEWRRRIITELLANSNLPNKEQFIDFIEQYMKKQAEDLVKMMSDRFRQGFSVLSLSADCRSKLMWSHYSDSHAGFAIEYDFGVLPYNDIRRRLCFPVFYTKKLRDATRYLARADMARFNNLFGQYMCLIKEHEWAYEKEWRIIHAIGPSHANAELEMPKPSAVILGSQVAQRDEALMRDLCRSRAIPLRRMVQRPGRFDLTTKDVPL